MEYYLKKCGSQELGSVERNHGRAQRGRYLLTSMNPAVLSFFPPLSQTQRNDCVLLPIIPLYSRQKVYCSFVYHNDKYHGSTANNPRNEYRLYLNRSLEGSRQRFQTGDIVIMRKETIQDGDEAQTVYLLDLLQEHGSAQYAQLNAAIEAYPIRGGYGMYEGNLSFFEEKVAQANLAAEPEVVIDETVRNQIDAADDTVLAKLFNAANFRDFVMFGYGGLCAVTGTVIRYGDYSNLEAAHIRPRSHGGLYLPNNGLALIRDLHWAFDKGFFTLNDALEVMVHPEATSEYLRSLEGKKIFLPKDPFFQPSLDNVRYHRERIYGLFLTAGRL